MPEEINRVATDALSDLLFASEEAGVENLRAEGVPEDNVFFAGNVMIDTLLEHRERAAGPGPGATGPHERGLRGADPAPAVERRRPRLWAACWTRWRGSRAGCRWSSPSTRAPARIEGFGLRRRLAGSTGCAGRAPGLPGLPALTRARLMLTDSGGIQEEATMLRGAVPDAAREHRAPGDPRRRLEPAGGDRPPGSAGRFRGGDRDADRCLDRPEVWDGRAGERIARVLIELGFPGLRRLQAARGIAPSSGPGPPATEGATGRRRQPSRTQGRQRRPVRRCTAMARPPRQRPLASVVPRAAPSIP